VKIRPFFERARPGLSFELFPPKTAGGLDSLMQTVGELTEFEPDFFTCTYGAGGSTRDRTLQVISQVIERYRVPVASHLTCVGSTKQQLREYVGRAISCGVSAIVALRGDPPAGSDTFTPVADGLRYANELVSLLQADFPELGVAVAGYPEVHQEAASSEDDLNNLKRKVDAGADIVVTQLFYQNDDFFRFRERCERKGIQVPIVPGILPVTNLPQIQRITGMCGAKLPQPFIDRLSQSDSESWHFQVGVEFATTQVRELLAQGVPGVHYYVLNKSQATRQVLEAIQAG
jgi:methylenetetrahydrofolate reductase (NADPH)